MEVGGEGDHAPIPHRAMMDMPAGMMWGMGIAWLLILILLILGIAALIKYLRS